MRTHILLLTLLLLPVTAASPTLADSVEVTLTSTVELEGTGNPTDININKSWIPISHEAQTVSVKESNGDVNKGTIQYQTPSTPYTGKTTFTITSERNEPRITETVPFPLQKASIPQEYLEHTALIDTSPEIERVANRIASKHNDTARIVSEIGEWVTTNIEYDLSTSNRDASIPSSQVIQNQNGVCDELTNLFISMLRSVGIPARFVAGYSYTESELFDEPWGPHGWAEVYYPGQGWVPYDPTYGQYGYVDASHIVFTTSKDGERSSTTYTWKQGKITAKTTTDVTLLKETPPSLNTMRTAFSHPEKVKFGSAFILTYTVFNPTDSYYTTRLRVFPTEGIQSNQAFKTVTVPPQSQESVQWELTIDTTLDERYVYTMPIKIFDDRTNSTSETVIEASANAELYTQNIEEQHIEESSSCSGPNNIYTNESITVTCTSQTPAKTCYNERCSDLGTTRSVTFTPQTNATAIRLDHSNGADSIYPVTIVPPPQLTVKNTQITYANVQHVAVQSVPVPNGSTFRVTNQWLPEGSYTVPITVTYTDMHGEQHTTQHEVDVTIQHESVIERVKGFIGNILSVEPSVHVQ